MHFEIEYVQCRPTDLKLIIIKWHAWFEILPSIACENQQENRWLLYFHAGLLSGSHDKLDCFTTDRHKLSLEIGVLLSEGIF